MASLALIGLLVKVLRLDVSEIIQDAAEGILHHLEVVCVGCDGQDGRNRHKDTSDWESGAMSAASGPPTNWGG